MLETIQQVLRKKFRTFLSILGISIGVFALIVMGAMSEHFNILSRHFEENFKNKLFVCEKISFWSGGGILAQNKVKLLKNIPEILKAVPILISRFRENQILSLGFPEVIVGINPKDMPLIYSQNFLLKGKFLEGNSPQAVIGWDLADRYKIKLNDTIKIRNSFFQIIGILEKTSALEDRQVIIPLYFAQKALSRENLITSIIVFPQDNINLEQLVFKIKKNILGISIITPREFKDQINQNLNIWNIITLGAAILSAITGILCIMINLFITINDRLPEIGLRKAIGATSWNIIEEYLLEALVLSIGGWILGLFSGLIFIKLFDFYIKNQGVSLFSITHRLIILSFFWIICLGIMSGIYPAYQASNIDPARAMRR
ncbi:MAG: ABC transporter permease [Armatimonadetes bacterium]|nr:ABC transporter permease [Armatimonadota bacterium]